MIEDSQAPYVSSMITTFKLQDYSTKYSRRQWRHNDKRNERNDRQQEECAQGVQRCFCTFCDFVDLLGKTFFSGEIATKGRRSNVRAMAVSRDTRKKCTKETVVLIFIDISIRLFCHFKGIEQQEICLSIQVQSEFLKIYASFWLP